ncbi:MAG TPA: hypothetical protein DIW64_16780 [Cellvibrio sp.]|nr:hypothetical protein [Cellvibrio sp.]
MLSKNIEAPQDIKIVFVGIFVVLLWPDHIGAFATTVTYFSRLGATKNRSPELTMGLIKRAINPI